VRELIRWLSLATILTTSFALLSSCDPPSRETPHRSSWEGFSDLPQAAVGIWYDTEGMPLPRGEPLVMSVSRGPGHCDWEDVLFLRLSWPLGTPFPGPIESESIQFARWQGDEFPPSHFATSFDANTTLPADAHDTGYHRSGWHLWVVDKEIHRSVWLVHGSVTERWPAPKDELACV
jgi:hypothetical protein